MILSPDSEVTIENPNSQMDVYEVAANADLKELAIASALKFQRKAAEEEVLLEALIKYRDSHDASEEEKSVAAYSAWQATIPYENNSPGDWKVITDFEHIVLTEINQVKIAYNYLSDELSVPLFDGEELIEHFYFTNLPELGEAILEAAEAEADTF